MLKAHMGATHRYSGTTHTPKYSSFRAFNRETGAEHHITVMKGAGMPKPAQKQQTPPAVDKPEQPKQKESTGPSIPDLAGSMGMTHQDTKSKTTRSGFLGRGPEMTHETHFFTHKTPHKSVVALHAAMARTHNLSSLSQRRVQSNGRIRHLYSFTAKPKAGGSVHTVNVMAGE